MNLHLSDVSFKEIETNHHLAFEIVQEKNKLHFPNAVFIQGSLLEYGIQFKDKKTMQDFAFVFDIKDNERFLFVKLFVEKNTKNFFLAEYCTLPKKECKMIMGNKNI